MHGLTAAELKHAHRVEIKFDEEFDCLDTDSLRICYVCVIALTNKKKIHLPGEIIVRRYQPMCDYVRSEKWTDLTFFHDRSQGFRCIDIDEYTHKLIKDAFGHNKSLIGLSSEMLQEIETQSARFFKTLHEG